MVRVVRVNLRAEVDVISVPRLGCSIAKAIFPSIALIRLLPPPDDRRLLPTPKETHNLRLWVSFCEPTSWGYATRSHSFFLLVICPRMTIRGSWSCKTNDYAAWILTFFLSGTKPSLGHKELKDQIFL